MSEDDDYYRVGKVTVMVPVEVLEYSNIGQIREIPRLPTREDVERAYVWGGTKSPKYYRAARMIFRRSIQITAADIDARYSQPYLMTAGTIIGNALEVAVRTDGLLHIIDHYGRKIYNEVPPDAVEIEY